MHTGPKLWVLGNGQLGAMLKHAGESIDIEVIPLAIDSDGKPPVLDSADSVTAEREHWPANPIADQLFQHANFSSRRAFTEIADRCNEKTLFDRLGLANTPWCLVNDQTSVGDLYEKLGNKIVLKRRSGGYDGKGQQWLRATDNDDIPADWHGNAIAEQAIAFDEEVSLIGARNASGQSIFYPLTLNLHQDGILLASLAPLDRLQPYQDQAEFMLAKLMDELDYIGVLTMECFRLGDQLMINEVAPRVHNSGHWTMDGASLSQFDLHVRAVMALPISQPDIIGKSVMINLLGLEWNPLWSTVPYASVYWYDKEVLPGRKLGHINLNVQSRTQLDDALSVLSGLLSDRYHPIYDWLRSNF
ncbi:MAG: 5-(carboxyamino)imidazole ribonucleotide synthase [Gammaproteobacteria bacterium]|nr:5-(carboxyamino)imidazole ribonucleotide synthase [Gammaproteobacteria bacterium]